MDMEASINTEDKAEDEEIDNDESSDSMDNDDDEDEKIMTEVQNFNKKVFLLK